jgi:hypothetical protein
MKLELTKWDKYYPDLGNNRALPVEGRVYLEVERGLSTRAREAFFREVLAVFSSASEPQTEGAPTFPHRLAAVLSMHLRFGKEPLRHEGGEVTTLEDFVALLLDLGQQEYLDEVIGLVRKANSFGKQDADFFARPSGTAPGTSDGLPPATV